MQAEEEEVSAAVQEVGDDQVVSVAVVVLPGVMDDQAVSVAVVVLQVAGAGLPEAVMVPHPGSGDRRPKRFEE